jgi:hypothetical protein
MSDRDRTATRRLIPPRVHRSIGLDPAQGHRIARADPHLRETLRWSGERVAAYLTDLDLIDGPVVRSGAAPGFCPPPLDQLVSARPIDREL